MRHGFWAQVLLTQSLHQCMNLDHRFSQRFISAALEVYIQDGHISQRAQHQQRVGHAEQKIFLHEQNERLDVVAGQFFVLFPHGPNGIEPAQYIQEF